MILLIALVALCVAVPALICLDAVLDPRMREHRR